MWRLCFGIVGLLAGPVLAQPLRHSGDDYERRSFDHGIGDRGAGDQGQWGGDQRAGRHHGPAHERPRHGPRRPGTLSLREIELSGLAPAPTGFWFRCDAPAGYYPYVLACHVPWRIVLSGLFR